MAQIICPKCGSSNIGSSAAHKFKKGATYAADVALGYIGGYYGGDLAVDVLSKTGGVSGNVSIKKEYECRDCGYIWKGEDVVRIPDHVIQQQKDKLEAMNKANANSSLKWGVIYGLVTAVCALYCFCNRVGLQYILCRRVITTLQLICSWIICLNCIC